MVAMAIRTQALYSRRERLSLLSEYRPYTLAVTNVLSPALSAQVYVRLIFTLEVNYKLSLPFLEEGS
jgi:hypothetical protein